ncbi:MAG: S49 family peptidase, partial [Alphaproteobacteria bacterium]
MDPEVILDRRRLRRRASFWRVAAFVLAAIAVVALVMAAGGIDGSARRAQVAEIAVSGFIDTNPDAVENIAAAAKADAVKAIILKINSPGGAASGGEALYQAVRKAAAEKPVVAVIEGLGASGAYMTAIAADRIIARESALTGSIGVILQFPNVEGLLGKIGVQYHSIKSAPLKAAPDMFSTPDPAAVAVMQAIVDDTFDWFVGLVADR